MNDTELLDWAFYHLFEFRINLINVNKFLMKWIDKEGNEQHTQGVDLRNCIRKAIETEQQNKTTATVERRPLTEEQIKDCIWITGSFGNVRLTYTDFPYNKTCITEEAIALVRAIEKAHGIKEQ